MIYKLQKKTLVISQIFGYSLSMLIGISIILIVVQLYADMQALISQQTDVFENKSLVVSKNISVFKTVDKEKIYFSDKEIESIENEAFTKKVSKFSSANFKINAYSNQSEKVPVFYTDLFFESIPDEYLDVNTEEWKWNKSSQTIPIVIPENYLNLYNFGFAESQGLPVVSKNTISQIEFNIQLSGNNRTKKYKSKIVGFSSKINSILVPEDFLYWANNEFGAKNKNKTSRILVEFNKPNDKAILNFFNENNYSINQDKLELNKIIFFLQSTLIFLFSIAFIIILLSISFILLSFNLLIQKNKIQLINLYQIGYSVQSISKFYQILISITTILSILSAILISFSIRKYYLKLLKNYFELETSFNYIHILGFLLLLVLVIVYNLSINKNITKIVKPQASF